MPSSTTLHSVLTETEAALHHVTLPPHPPTNPVISLLFPIGIEWISDIVYVSGVEELYLKLYIDIYLFSPAFCSTYG